MLQVNTTRMVPHFTLPLSGLCGCRLLWGPPSQPVPLQAPGLPMITFSLSPQDTAGVWKDGNEWGLTLALSWVS